MSSGRKRDKEELLKKEYFTECLTSDPYFCTKMGSEALDQGKILTAKEHFATGCDLGDPKGCHLAGILHLNYNSKILAKDFLSKGCSEVQAKLGIHQKL